MESANIFGNSTKFENSYKMDIEQAHNLNHSNMVKNYLYSHRTMNTFPFGQKFQNGKQILVEPFNTTLILKNIDEITIILTKFNNFLFNVNKTEIDKMRNNLFEYLKQIRKELSKDNISLIDARSIFNGKINNFIELLLKDTYDPYIQLESLWIINNLMFLIAKYNNCIFFDVKNISNSLIQYLINIYKNQKNEGVKYTLVDKIFRIFGNLIHIDNNIIELLIKNQIIPFVINSLNSPVSSFRTTCLWLINKIILILKKLDAIDYIKIFIEKNAISNYKFILSRIDNLRSFEEIGELFWLFNELVKYNSSFLIPIFFIDNTNINNNTNIININYNYNLDCYPIKTFEFVLNNCLTSKMFQTSFRLISNLLIVCLNDLKNENLVSKFTEILFSKENILGFIKDILNSPKNKYDISLVKDILLLIFNLVCISQIKSSALFKNGIVNLINNIDYQNDNEIMKLLFFTYYRILRSNSFIFEPNDEKVIKTCLVLMERFKDDSSILIIFIDIIFLYLKASHTKIADEIENELRILCDLDDNISVPIEKLQLLAFKLTNFVKIHSPLSRFMREQ